MSFNNRALIVLFFTGFASIATEVGWMKYLIIYTSNTIYGFSFILSIFLAGLAIGSWFAKHRMISGSDPRKVLFAGLLLLGVMLVFARAGLSLFPEIYEQINMWEVNSFVLKWSKYLVMFLMLFPATFLFGMLFPVALRFYSSDIERLYEHVGRAYAVNIVAGIAGSIAAGFWLIPYFGTDVLLSVMAFVVLSASLVFITDIKSKKARLAPIGFIALFFPFSAYMPHIDYFSMIEMVVRRDNIHITKENRPRLHFIKEGKAGVISMVSYDSSPCIVKLWNNDMSESWIDVCDRENLLLGEFLLGQIPYLLNSSAKTAFVLGYGGGTTLRALSFNDLKRIDVAELEPAIVDASRSLFAGRLPMDNDPRVHIDFDDARNTLLMSRYKYDIIVSQASHPWLSGGANIMSRDFFEIAKSRLAPGGIYAQWAPLFKIDVSTLKSIIKAYTDTFEYVVSFADFYTQDLLLFGSSSPIVLDHEKIDGIISSPEIRAVLKRYNIENSYDLMRRFALTREELVLAAGSAEPATDVNLLTEVFSSRYDENDKSNSFDTRAFLQNIKRSGQN